MFCETILRGFRGYSELFFCRAQFTLKTHILFRLPENNLLKHHT